MTTPEAELQEALDLPEAKRIALIYESFYGDTFQADDSSGDEAKKARNLYAILEAKARDIVCGSTTITGFASRAGDAKITLALLVCDALATAFQKPTVFLMSAQIVTLGIKQFCEKQR